MTKRSWAKNKYYFVNIRFSFRPTEHGNTNSDQTLKAEVKMYITNDISFVVVNLNPSMKRRNFLICRCWIENRHFILLDIVQFNTIASVLMKM